VEGLGGPLQQRAQDALDLLELLSSRLGDALGAGPDADLFRQAARVDADTLECGVHRLERVQLLLPCACVEFGSPGELLHLLTDLRAEPRQPFSHRGAEAGAPGVQGDQSPGNEEEHAVVDGVAARALASLSSCVQPVPPDLGQVAVHPEGEDLLVQRPGGLGRDREGVQLSPGQGFELAPEGPGHGEGMVHRAADGVGRERARQQISVAEQRLPVAHHVAEGLGRAQRGIPGRAIAALLVAVLDEEIGQQLPVFGRDLGQRLVVLPLEAGQAGKGVEGVVGQVGIREPAHARVDRVGPQATVDAVPAHPAVRLSGPGGELEGGGAVLSLLILDGGDVAGRIDQAHQVAVVAVDGGVALQPHVGGEELAHALVGAGQRQGRDLGFRREDQRRAGLLVRLSSVLDTDAPVPDRHDEVHGAVVAADPDDALDRARLTGDGVRLREQRVAQLGLGLEATRDPGEVPEEQLARRSGGLDLGLHSLHLSSTMTQTKRLVAFFLRFWYTSRK
jgi:hypothetical protein